MKRKHISWDKPEVFANLLVDENEKRGQKIDDYLDSFQEATIDAVRKGEQYYRWEPPDKIKVVWEKFYIKLISEFLPKISTPQVDIGLFEYGSYHLEMHISYNVTDFDNTRPNYSKEELIKQAKNSLELYT